MVHLATFSHSRYPLSVLFSLSRSSLGVGPSSKVGGGVQSLGGPPVEGLYDHPTASPARSNTPFIPGELVTDLLVNVHIGWCM